MKVPVFGVVPRVVGLSRWDARRLLVQAGFVASVPDGVGDDNVVCGQDPSPGAVCESGATVSLSFGAPASLRLGQGRSFQVLLMAVVAGFALLIFGFVVVGGGLGGGRPSSGVSPGLPVEVVTVPDLDGVGLSRAGVVLGRSGLGLGKRTFVVSDAPVGVVVGQAPAAGRTVPRGTQVVVMVSAGGEEVAVPNVVGMSQSEAAAVLTSAGLLLGDVTASDGPEAAGVVVGQVPSAGVMVSSGGRVGLKVSTGNVKVPQVGGLLWGEASAVLRSAGFVPVRVEVPVEPGRVGLVVGQSPVGGETTPSGSTVQVRVGVDQPAAAPVPAPVPAPAPTASPPAPTATPSAAPDPAEPSPTGTPTAVPTPPLG